LFKELQARLARISKQIDNVQTTQKLCLNPEQARMLEIETSNTYTTFQYLLDKTVKMNDEFSSDQIKYEEHMQSRL
jgi:hypothetical protein